MRADRKQGRGSGIALFLDSDIKVSVIYGPSETESVRCTLYLKNGAIVIGVVYHTPGSPIDQMHTLCNFMHFHNPCSSDLICMGNFNLPGVQWSSFLLSSRNALISSELLDFVIWSKAISRGGHQRDSSFF